MCSAYIQNRDISIDELLQYMPGPDFPTGGRVINKDDIPTIMRTGHGSVKIQGLYKVEKNNLVFYEIPYGQTIEGLVAEIGQACEEEKIKDVEEEHVTMYESLIDPKETMWEKLLIHEFTEVCNYYTCMEDEVDERIKKTWELFLNMRMDSSPFFFLIP